MRIQDSDIQLSARRERDYRQEVKTSSQFSFRTVLRDVSQAEADKASGEKERLVRLLQSLVDAILDAMDGKKCPAEIADCQDLSPARPQSRLEREIEWHWESTETISEHERTEVEARGAVRTADGRSIDFKLGLEMCRDYRCERTYREEGKAVLQDPLVINFDGKAAELTQNRIEFDLDGDGKVELVPGLGAGSGFLVLDRDGNGRADSGGELFGAKTGDGFGELSQLDSDGNGWLDEADPRFADLKVWRGGTDAGKLASLAELGIGALWLGAAESPFSLKDQANMLLGEIRATGLYLSEDGRVGSLQQVDLAVTSPEETPAA